MVPGNKTGEGLRKTGRSLPKCQLRPQSRGADRTDSDFLTDSRCLWTKEDDLSASVGRRSPGWRFELSKTADHRIERVEGLRDESRLPVLRYEKGFFLDDSEQLAVRKRRKLGESLLHGTSLPGIPKEVQNERSA